MFRIGDKVIWDGRVPYSLTEYWAMEFKERKAVITEIDKGIPRLNHQILTSGTVGNVYWWVNRRNLRLI